MALLRTFFTYGLFPLVFTSALFGAAWGLSAGVNAKVLLASITGITIAIIAVVERIHPQFPRWNQSRKDVKTDLWHAGISMVALPPLIEMGLLLVLLHVATTLSEAWGGTLWPHQWPLFAQLLLAMTVSQFGEYWAHRSMHEIPLLWRLHATHHSPKRLYWLNAARFHPLDAGFLQIVALGPLILLGAGESLFLLYSVWVAVHGLFQHCNIHVRLGPLNHFFSMAELHRWHHSLHLEEANANYGNNMLLWDWVFGTVYNPKDREASEEIGLSDIPQFPKGYWGQITSPWRWKAIQEEPRNNPPS